MFSVYLPIHCLWELGLDCLRRKIPHHQLLIISSLEMDSFVCERLTHYGQMEYKSRRKIDTMVALDAGQPPGSLDQKLWLGETDRGPRKHLHPKTIPESV